MCVYFSTILRVNTSDKNKFGIIDTACPINRIDLAVNSTFKW